MLNPHEGGVAGREIAGIRCHGKLMERKNNEKR